MILVFVILTDDLSVKIFKIKPGKGESSLKIEYSQKLNAFRNQLRSMYKKKRRK